MLAALEDAGQQMLAHNLEEGEWSLRGIEVTVKVGMSQVLIDVALGPEPKRVIQAALSKAAGRPLQVQDGERRCADCAEAGRAASERTARGRAAGRPPILRAAYAGKVRRRDSYGHRPQRSRLRLGEFMDGFNLQEMLAQARQQAEKLQEKMQQITVEASSGGGSVTVKMTGQKQLLSVVIEPEVVKSGDIEMLQDLVIAAVNEASRKVDDALKSSLGGMFGGMGLPGM